MIVGRGSRDKRRVAHQVFFPVAAVYGALLPPVSLAVMSGLAPGLPGLADGAGHGHEMLFGFALAVVAGYLLGPQPRRRLAALLALWIAGRVAFLAAPGNALGALINAGFAVAVAALVAPKFLGAAKKMRNQAFAPVVVGISVLATLAQIARLLHAGAAEHVLLVEAVLLFALLALFMGGRIIAAAAAGQRYKQGEKMDVRVQPRLEGALIAGITSCRRHGCSQAARRWPWCACCAGGCGSAAAAPTSRPLPWATGGSPRAWRCSAPRSSPAGWKPSPCTPSPSAGWAA